MPARAVIVTHVSTTEIALGPNCRHLAVRGYD